MPVSQSLYAAKILRKDIEAVDLEMKSLHSKVTLHHENGKYHPFMNQPCSVVDRPCYNLTGSTLGIPS
jgi:hypothetical protein